MEGTKKRLLLLLCLIQRGPFVDTTPKNCPEKQHESLHCFNDYNRVLTCTWNIINLAHTPGQVCALKAVYVRAAGKPRYNSSCELKAFDISRPKMQRCSMNFFRNGTFQANHVLNVTLTCPLLTLSMKYTPICHIKANPPSNLSINMTTVSWISRLKHERQLDKCTCELQWKREDQPWSVSSVHQKNNTCNGNSERNELVLEEEELIRGEQYQMRVRIMCEKYDPSWSDWSPNVSWVSTVGNKRVSPSPPPEPDTLTHLLVIIFGAAAACSIALILFWSNKDKWVYILKRVSGPSLPDPSKSFLKDADFQKCPSPYFSPESFHTALKPVEIVQVGVVDCDCLTPLTIMEKFISDRFHGSSSSSFFNPIYSHVFSSPLPSMAVGNLVPCLTDSPYGQVREESTVEQLNMEKLLKMVLNDKHKGLLSKVNQEKVETGAEGGQALDHSTKSHVDIQRFFARATGGGVFGSGSIQLCTGYKPVSCQQDDHVELPSQDSGVGSESEDISHKDNVETSNTHPPPSLSPCFVGLSPAQQMQILEQMATMSGSMGPSADGYNQVRQQLLL